MTTETEKALIDRLAQLNTTLFYIEINLISISQGLNKLSNSAEDTNQRLEKIESTLFNMRLDNLESNEKGRNDA